MLGLGVQNFLSAATGIAVLAALVRGLARRSATTIGNCWVDLTRCTLYHPAAALDCAGGGAREPGRGADVPRARQGR